MMKNLKLKGILALSILMSAFSVAQNDTNQDESKSFYVKPYAGFIGIQNMNLQLTGSDLNSDVSVENGFGYTAGIALGYRLTQNISTEIGWEYKTNEVTLTNNNIESKGDYASNFIYLNGIYNFNSEKRLQPYLGLGLSLIQEIDLDFGTGENGSFSNSGNIGFQGIAGLDFNLSPKWALNWEAKYVTFSQFDMENESDNSRLNNLKYNPFIFNLGVKYRF